MKPFSVFAALLIVSTLSLSGCKSSQPAPTAAPDQSAAPAAPANESANGAGSAMAPAPQRTAPQRTAPVQSQPAPVAVRQAPPPPPAPVALVAPIGTRVLVRTTETLSASRNEVGDSFSGVLDSPVTVDGATIFARGARVTGTVVAAKGRGRFKGAGALGIELNTIAGLNVQTNEYERETKGKGKRTGALVGGGAGLGALIGGIAGGGKGALIGGLAGAGAGTAGAAYTGNKDVILEAESLITFNLVAPVTVRR